MQTLYVSNYKADKTINQFLKEGYRVIESNIHQDLIIVKKANIKSTLVRRN